MIRYTIDPKEVNCNNNIISEFDLSSNLKLKSIDCSTNLLRNLYLSQNQELEGPKTAENKIKRSPPPALKNTSLSSDFGDAFKLGYQYMASTNIKNQLYVGGDLQFSPYSGTTH